MMDQNGDGRLSHDDLESLRSGENSGTIDQLESLADQNQDGKLGMEDLKNFDLGGTVDNIKNKFF